MWYFYLPKKNRIDKKYNKNVIKSKNLYTI